MQQQVCGTVAVVVAAVTVAAMWPCLPALFVRRVRFIEGNISIFS